MQRIVTTSVSPSKFENETPEPEVSKISEDSDLGTFYIISDMVTYCT